MTEHKLPKLPYEYDALEPHIDEKTMRIHHSKHHQGYVNKLNKALAKHEGHKAHAKLSERSVQELLTHMHDVPDNIVDDVRNNGGGHANHKLFWQIMTPGGKKPSATFQKVLADTFGSLDEFKKEFKEAATSVFGSGWAWLVLDHEDELEVMTTSNQDSPHMDGKKPILGVDVWEHAYYLNVQNKRGDYVDNFMNVINWEKVEEHYKNATN